MNKILNLLTKEQVSLLKTHFDFTCGLMQTVKDESRKNTAGYGSHEMYADPMTENVLNHLHPIIQEAYGKELCPTYSFWRRYYQGQDCRVHKDRPSCEVSITLNVGGTPRSDWSFFVEGKEFALSQGQGVIYKGHEQTHYRNPLPYESHTQIFLHYIEKNGKFYPIEKYDRRSSLYQPPAV